MYAVATAANLPVLPLCLRSVQQTRVPRERNADRAPVHQSDAQRIVRNIYVFDALVSPRCQNTHARPPIAQFGVRSPVIVAFATPVRCTPSCEPSQQDQAKTSRTDRLYQRERAAV